MEDREHIPKLYLPDHDIPDLLVHCSGGIGRSGTFLAAFHHYSQYRDILEHKTTSHGKLLEDTKEQSAVSIKETVHFMRLQRHPWMVEGNNQYNLAYMAITLLLKQILDEFH